MLNRFLCLVALLLIVFSADAQLYIRGGLGYSLPAQGETQAGSEFINGSSKTIAAYYVLTSTGSSSTTATQFKQASYSAGVQGYFGIGYKLNGNIAVELDENSGIANRIFSFDNYSVSQNNGHGTIYDVLSSRKAANFTVLVPSVVFKTNFAKLGIYGRFGVAVPVYARVTYTATATEDGTLYGSVCYEQKNKFNVGTSSAIGASYLIGRNLNLWCEVSALTLSLQIKEADLNSYTLPHGHVPADKIVYSTSCDLTYQYTTEGALPAYEQPFSNVAMAMGVSYMFR